MIYSAHALLVCFIMLFSFTETVQQPAPSLIHEQGTTVQTRINVPAGYERVPVTKGSFAEYMRQQPLKPHGSRVHLFNGDLKSSNVHVAVMTVDVGKKDLQQCADAVMRLRAEYLFKEKEYSKIHFKFTNGFNATYSKWAEGYRIKVSGNTVSWYKTTDVSNSYESFRKYMDIVFTYAGTLSLSKELKPIAFKDLQVGDVFIRGGSPGHAVIVTDVAQDKNGKNIFIISQSYMPAQEIHILKNLNTETLSPWYDLNTENTLYTPEWTFEKSELKRFVD